MKIKKDIRKEIKKIIEYLDSTIEAGNATEPNAQCVSRLLKEALKKTK